MHSLLQLLPRLARADIPQPSSELARRVGSCTVNPLSNLPFDMDAFAYPDTSKTVLVVGGGPAGMQAAITAAKRGHKVFLAEKAERLGGLLTFADADVDKDDLRRFKDLLIRLTLRSGVNILLSRTADEALLEKNKPDAVILAIGSHPAVPAIPGIDTIRQATDIYYGYAPGKRVIMVGGGLVGCEVGLHLAKSGHTVTIIEWPLRVANDSFGMYREALVGEMHKEGILLLTEARCLEVAPSSVRISDSVGNETVVRGDCVLYALGMMSNSTKELEKIIKNTKTYKVGDCVRPAKVDSAIIEGFMAAINIIQHSQKGRFIYVGHQLHRHAKELSSSIMT